MRRAASLVPDLYAVDADYALSELCKDEQKLEKVLLGREFHVSLGRTVGIQVHQIDSLVAMLRQKFQAHQRLASFQKFIGELIIFLPPLVCQIMWFLYSTVFGQLYTYLCHGLHLCRCFKSYWMDFNKWEHFVNDDSTRSFLSLEVTRTGLPEVLATVCPHCLVPICIIRFSMFYFGYGYLSWLLYQRCMLRTSNYSTFISLFFFVFCGESYTALVWWL